MNTNLANIFHSKLNSRVSDNAIVAELSFVIRRRRRINLVGIDGV